MLERAGQNVSNDLHVPVRVCRKPFTGRHPVFIDDSQCTPVRMTRIVILIERKGVIGIKPAVVEVTAVLRFADCNHQQYAGVSPANQKLTTEGMGEIKGLQIAWINSGISSRVKI